MPTPRTPYAPSDLTAMSEALKPWRSFLWEYGTLGENCHDYSSTVPTERGVLWCLVVSSSHHWPCLSDLPFLVLYIVLWIPCWATHQTTVRCCRASRILGIVSCFIAFLPQSATLLLNTTRSPTLDYIRGCEMFCPRPTNN